LTTTLGKHDPNTEGSHSFATGQHWTHWIVALAPNTMLVAIMINQINTFSQPLEIRSSVIAKEVLLQSVARMEQNPAMYEYITTP
jgi:hypothetical protein